MSHVVYLVVWACTACRRISCRVLSFQLQVVESRCRLAVSEKEKLEVKVVELEKERKSSDKKLSHQLSRLTKLTAELKEEKEVCLETVQCVLQCHDYVLFR